MLKYNGELNFKALIPFTLTIKLDGIGGIVVGEIFKIKGDKTDTQPSILPQNYIDKNLGFIITNIQHDLVKNDWETTLQTQICLLDAVELGEDFIKFNREGFKEFLAKGVKDSLLYPALVAFIEYQAIKSLLLLIYDLTNGYTYEFSDGTEVSVFAEPYPTIGSVVYLKQQTDTVYLNNDRNNIKKVWDFRVKNVLNSPYDTNIKSTGTPVNYKIADFGEFLKEWVKRYRLENASSLSTLISADQTLGEALTEIVSEPYYSENVLPLSTKLSENVSIFSNPSLWSGVFDNVNYKVGTKTAINYTALQKNIENELLNKNVISSNINNAYYLLPFYDGTLQPELNPLNTPVSYGGNKSMYQRFQLFSNPTTNIVGTTDYAVYFEEEYKNIVKTYLNNMYRGNVSVGNNSDPELTNNGIEEVLDKNFK
jgi:hypothetical protein